MSYILLDFHMIEILSKVHTLFNERGGKCKSEILHDNVNT